jgi:TPR repeat protein
LGVKRNLAESRRWYQLAAAQGDSEAAKARKDLDGGKRTK